MATKAEKAAAAAAAREQKIAAAKAAAEAKAQKEAAAKAEKEAAARAAAEAKAQKAAAEKAKKEAAAKAAAEAKAQKEAAAAAAKAEKEAAARNAKLEKERKAAAAKAAAAEAKAIKAAESAELQQVKAAQKAETILLKKQGVPTSVIKAEEKSNKAEYANAKTTLAAPGKQTMLTDGQTTFFSAASNYSGDVATNVQQALTKAADKYNTLGLVNVSKSGDTTLGLGIDKIVQYDLGKAGPLVKLTLDKANQLVGKTFTPEELKAQKIKVASVKGAEGIFQHKAGSDGNYSYTFFRQDANGNYVGIGANQSATPAKDGGFFSSGIGKALAIAGSIALAVTPGGQAFAAQIGGALSGGVLSGAAAQALGQAAIRGVSTGVITGDVEKGLIAGALSGAGSALNLSGELGNFMDNINLGDYKDAFGVIGGNASEASMAAADAVGQAAAGLGADQIASNLIASGVSASTAQTAAQLAVQGATTAGITNTLSTAARNAATGAFDAGGAAGTGLMDYSNVVSDGLPVTEGITQVNPITGEPFTGTFDASGAADLSRTGAFDTGGANMLTGTTQNIYDQLDQAGLLSNTSPFDLTGAEGTGLLDATAPVTNLDFPYNPNYVEPSLLSSGKNLGEAVVGALMSGTAVGVIASQLGLSTSQVQSIADSLGLGGGTGGGVGGAGGGTGNMFGNLINAGIDYATASKIAGDLEGQAQSLRQRAEAVGREAQVPFTPYTLTTGTGTTTLGPQGATSMLSPELQALQQQQIGLAGQTLGAINPAQAAQDLYTRAEALAAPSREREQEALLGRLGARGLLGISRNLPTVGGQVSGVNPFLESLLSSQRTAQAQTALQAQQFGTQEAMRQQQLAAGFQTGALGLDTQALNQLARAQGLSQDQIQLALRNAEAQRLASLEGLRLAAPLYTAAGNVRAGQTAAVGEQTQGLFDYIFS